MVVNFPQKKLRLKLLTTPSASADFQVSFALKLKLFGYTEEWNFGAAVTKISSFTLTKEMNISKTTSLTPACSMRQVTVLSIPST